MRPYVDKLVVALKEALTYTATLGVVNAVPTPNELIVDVEFLGFLDRPDIRLQVISSNISVLLTNLLADFSRILLQLFGALGNRVSGIREKIILAANLTATIAITSHLSFL